MLFNLLIREIIFYKSRRNYPISYKELQVFLEMRNFYFKNDSETILVLSLAVS